MRVRIAQKASFLLLAVLLSSCQLLGGGTQVRFENSTTFSLVSIQFGSLLINSPLAPGPATGYFPVFPGQSVLTAESQAGTWTNGILLSVAAGQSYTITFSGTSFETMTVTMEADN
jgi:hypothetical protein